MNREAVLAELVTLAPGITPERWDELAVLDEEGLRIALALYRGASWTREPSTLERVADLFGALVQVAAGVSGVAGAVAAVKGLAS